MKTHHTPGPWIYKIRHDGSAYMSRGDPKTGPHHQSDVYGSVDDIRLMASAPDLLAALQSAVTMLAAFCGTNGEYPDEQEVISKCREALAKATTAS